MKALEKDRDRRYASANELAADIERHLRNEPVLAGPPSGRYRLAQVRAATPRAWRRRDVTLALAAGRGRHDPRAVRAPRAEARQAEAETARRSRLPGRPVRGRRSERARGSTITAREILDAGASGSRASSRASRWCRPG